MTRRKFITDVSCASASVMLADTGLNHTNGLVTGGTTAPEPAQAQAEAAGNNWQVGIGRRVITPEIPVWLAGYGTKRVAYGKLHDIYVKVLALKSEDGTCMVMATTDNQGMSKTVYEQIYTKVNRQFGIARERFMLTFSHSHSSPCLPDDLVDYYPSDAKQRALVKAYADWMTDQVIAAVAEALDNWQDARLFHGEGHCTFAVNRRDNKESEVPAMLAAGESLKGVVDHAVPVLAIKGSSNNLIAVLFGYACHPTTLSFNTWSGDYPGFAQLNLEAALPGTAAMFFNTCGGDQNPLPRRTVPLCEKYGRMLSDAVVDALSGPMKALPSSMDAAFRYVDLRYEENATRETLLPVASGTNELSARWARRMLGKLDAGAVFRASYPYPVQAWLLGGQLLLIGVGGEAVVDYALLFKKKYGATTTWVCGYANEMVAYIPSRRVWEEGGYEGGPHLDEYGHPAWKWAGDVEERITGAVHGLVSTLKR